MGERRRYIARKQDRTTANRWYKRLRQDIWDELSFMPDKYCLRETKDPQAETARVVKIRKNVVVYTVEDEAGVVDILHILPAGNDLLKSVE